MLVKRYQSRPFVGTRLIHHPIFFLFFWFPLSCLNSFPSSLMITTAHELLNVTCAQGNTDSETHLTISSLNSGACLDAVISQNHLDSGYGYSL
jgi:hypothetical protein